MSDDKAVTATLARARRRLIAATFVRWICGASATGVTGLVLGAVLTGQPFAPGRLLLATGAVVLVLAAAMTTWRRPTLAQAAAVLDARLGLADLTVAAHSLRGSSAPMAQLVVRDARLRLASASLPQVLPMPRRLATWTSGASLAAVLLGLLVGGDGAPAGHLAPAGGTGRIVSGGGSASRRANAPGEAATEVPRPSSASRPRPNQPEGPRGPRDLDTPSTNAQATPSRGLTRGRQSGAPGAESSPDTASQSASRFGGSAGRGGAAPQASPRAAAGGVQQGAVTPDTAAEGRAPRLDSTMTADDIRQAARRAEAALARDEIPPRMKPVVRRYFQSIQSEPAR